MAGPSYVTRHSIFLRVEENLQDRDDFGFINPDTLDNFRRSVSLSLPGADPSTGELIFTNANNMKFMKEASEDNFISDKEVFLPRLRTQHRSLDYIIHNISENELRTRQNPYKWSIYENLVHIVVYQDVFRERLDIILKESTPVFAQYRAEKDENFESRVETPFEILIPYFIKSREELVNAIDDIKPRDLKRFAFHPVYGKMNINGWIEFFLLHEAHHLNTILKLTARYRYSSI